MPVFANTRATTAAIKNCLGDRQNNVTTTTTDRSTTNQNALNKNRTKPKQRIPSYLVLFSWLDKRGAAEETGFWGKRPVQMKNQVSMVSTQATTENKPHKMKVTAR